MNLNHNNINSNNNVLTNDQEEKYGCKNDERKDFIGMLNNQEYSDITLNVDGNLIYAH